MRILKAVFLISLLAASNAAASNIKADPESLAMLKQSDFVVVSKMIRKKQTPYHSVYTLMVDQVIKPLPSEKQPEMIRISTKSGSVIIDREEVQFMQNEKCVLFLDRKDGVFVLSQGKIGKKTIFNENVYLDPDESRRSVKLKDYIEALSHEEN